MANEILKSIKGRMLGLSHKGNLAGNNIAITQPCVDAAITVGAEDTNVRAITIQLKDIKGRAIDYVQEFEIVMLKDAAAADYVATGGSTGIEIGASGKLLTVVAKKLFRAVSTSAGVVALTWTDTGTEAAFLAVKLPNGRMVISDALANAGG